MVVDRIENGYAVIEKKDGTFFELPLSELPFDVHEGCVLVRNCEGYALDLIAEKKLRRNNIRKTHSLFK